MLKNITIIGSGNVATHLGKALLNNGYEINQVFSRNKDHAFELANHLNAMPCNDIRLITDESDLYLICIKDDFIKSIAHELTFRNKIAVHTSGSVPMDVLNTFDQHGIFYPLQTFSKETTLAMNEVPFCIEANNRDTQNQLMELASQLSKKVYPINSEQRKKIHLAAVFACNFSNYLYSISEEILSANNMNFDLLKPLILETAKKIQTNSPKEVQTGPAVRKDQEVINNHLALLANAPAYRDIYQLITNNIIKQNNG